MKTFFNILLGVGLFFMLGTVGALECDNISFGQAVIQSVIAFGICIPRVAYDFYRKYHNTI